MNSIFKYILNIFYKCSDRAPPLIARLKLYYDFVKNNLLTKRFPHAPPLSSVPRASNFLRFSLFGRKSDVYKTSQDSSPYLLHLLSRERFRVRVELGVWLFRESITIFLTGTDVEHFLTNYTIVKIDEIF